MPDYRRPAGLLQQASLLLQRMLPGSCVLCSSDSMAALCPECTHQFFSQHTLRCPVCARAMPHTPEVSACGACLAEPPAFDATIVACDYAAPADHLVQDLKFHARLALAPAFARLLARAWGEYEQHDEASTHLPALLTAVPLSRTRLAARGFNQALEIARPLAHHIGITLEPQLCLRTRDTQAQASLSMTQRQVNMRGAFVVAPQANKRVQPHVIVVDDVITTGHTLNELAACLKRFGAERVTNLVFARTPVLAN